MTKSSAASKTDCCAAEARALLEIRELSVFAREQALLRDVRLDIEAKQVFGIVGPSGAGKSTLLRAINRLLDLQPHFRVEGEIYFHGSNLYDASIDPDALRAKIGILFQQPVIFPASIEANVLFGIRHHRRIPKSERAAVVEKALRETVLWNEVRDRLKESALRLSVGQQQRLCLARTLAVEPEIVLMDEPTSALDAKSTAAIEELMLELKRTRTVVLVTHQLEQARRVADWIACLCPQEGVGRVLESTCCDGFFESEVCRRVFHGTR